jgi:flagellar motor switch protein FliN/FliY
MADDTINNDRAGNPGAKMTGQSAAESGKADDNAGENFQPAALHNQQDESDEKGSEDVNMDVILDIPVTISLEIGRAAISIGNLLHLNQGSVVELDRLAGEPLDVLVNGTLIAHGEVVVVNEKFGVRLTDVISAADRIKNLK